MKKVIFSQILAGNGVTNFSGLFDENGLPVRVELEKNADGVVLTVLRRELSEDDSRKSAWIMNTARIVRCGNNAMRSVMKYDP